MANQKSIESDPIDPHQSFDDLAQVLRERRCSDVLIVRYSSAEDNSLKKLSDRCNPTPCIEITDPATWSRHPHPERRYSTGIVWDSPPTLPDAGYEQLLARLRDLDCEAVYVRCLMQRGDFRSWSRQLRSLGFTPLKKYDDKTALFYFDIYDYKRVPDWLNSKFWANPQMWNKTRW